MALERVTDWQACELLGVPVKLLQTAAFRESLKPRDLESVKCQRLGLVMVHRTEPLVFTCDESARTRLMAFTELDCRMIATWRDDETSHSDDPKTNTKLTAHKTVCHIPVDVDSRVLKEILEFFPIIGVNYQTAELNRECRLIMATFILSALRDSEREFSISQEVQDKMTMVGHRKRKALISFLDQSRFFAVSVNYSTGNHSIIRSLKGVKFHRLYADQHNMVPCFDGILGSLSPLPSPAGSDSVADVSLMPLRSLSCHWAYSGKTCRVLIPVDWFRSYGQSYRNACTSLHSEQWHFISSIESSIHRTVIGRPTLEDCLRFASLRRAEPGKTLEDSWTDEKWAIETLKRWIEWKEDPLLYLNRVERRLYYPFVNQSKHLRRRYMQFKYDGIIEPAAEVDMSATFWVMLASMLDESPCKARLIRDLKEGRFYERLNEEVGRIYKDPSELKVAVQKHCLFGKEKFGSTLLFAAMMSLYPDLGRFIMHKRRNHDVKWLSDLLTNKEGSFFIDCLLPQIVKAGIPALPIHDAFCVPGSVAEQVGQMCCELAQERFGFGPRFKVSYNIVP